MDSITKQLRQILAVWMILLLPRAGFSQPVMVGPDQPINAQTRTAVIESLLQQLNTQYVFPNMAAQIQRAIQMRLTTGHYDPITSSKAFADTLTAHMQRISHDKHLRLFYHNKSVQLPIRESTSAKQLALN